MVSRELKSLDQLMDGALVERFNQELSKLMENVFDMRTDPNKRRRISLIFDFKPNERRDAAEMSAQTVKPSKKAKAEIREVTFNVHLHCNSCVKKIQENIAFEKGVKDLKVSLEEQTVYVKYDASKTNEEVLKNAIVKLGVPVIDKGHSGHDHKH